MAAIDIEVSARPRLERLRGIAPIGIARRLAGGRRTAQVADAGEMSELILAAVRVRIVAVDVPRLEADRSDAPRLEVGYVAARALVLVRHHVGEGLALAIGRDELERELIAGACQLRIGLLRIPDVGQRNPALLTAHEQARLDEPHLAQIEPGAVE